MITNEPLETDEMIFNFSPLYSAPSHSTYFSMHLQILDRKLIFFYSNELNLTHFYPINVEK